MSSFRVFSHFPWKGFSADGVWAGESPGNQTAENERIANAERKRRVVEGAGTFRARRAVPARSLRVSVDFVICFSRQKRFPFGNGLNFNLVFSAIGRSPADTRPGARGKGAPGALQFKSRETPYVSLTFPKTAGRSKTCSWVPWASTQKLAQAEPSLQAERRSNPLERAFIIPAL